MKLPDPPPPTLRLKLDTQALADNWRALDRLSGTARAGAAVKANAYGLGVDNVLPVLREAGAEDFFVAHWSEVPAVLRHAEPRRVAVLHYAPIRGTCDGEPPEIFPYLGSSRLEEPINRYRVSAVFHGHAHRGAAEGRTSTGVPVYNVAMPLLARMNPDRPPYLIVELPRAADPAASTPAPAIRADPVVKTA
jgi:Icc-related predicted phosphoesterase